MKSKSKRKYTIETSVIIVSFNTKKLTLEAIRSVIKEKESLSREIIVVDNASDDGTVEEITKLSKKIKLIKLITNKRNKGFAKANDQGIRVAKGKYILLLNSDTKIKKGAIGKLIKFAKRTPDAGVVGPKLLNPDGSVQPSVFRFPTISMAIRQYWCGEKGLMDKYLPATNSQLPVAVDSLTMAAFLITPEAKDAVGLLDERYFMYFEDLDYCKRVNKAGLKVYYLPTAEVVHQHGASGTGLAETKDQWRRLVPSSKIYHGKLKHSIINFIIWSGQKMYR